MEKMKKIDKDKNKKIIEELSKTQNFNEEDLEEIDPTSKYCTHPVPHVLPELGFDNIVTGEYCGNCGKPMKPN